MPNRLVVLFRPMIAIRIATFVRPKGGYVMKRALICGMGVVALMAGVQDVYAQARPAGVNAGGRPVPGEEPRAGGKAIRLEEEAEDDGAVGRHRLVPVAGRPPDELTRSARALVILEGALEHERLLQRCVLVQRH